MMLDLKIDGGDGDVNKYTAFVKHLKNLAELKINLDPDIYINAYFNDENGIELSNCETGIMAKVFENPVNKNLGVVIVNTENSPGECSIKMSNDLIEKQIKKIKLYRLDGDIRNIEIKNEFKIQLKEYDVNVVGIFF